MVGTMKHYHDYDNLIMRHSVVSVLISFSVRPWLCKSSAPEHCIKYFAKFIDHYEYFCNFVLGEYSDKGIFCNSVL